MDIMSSLYQIYSKFEKIVTVLEQVAVQNQDQKDHKISTDNRKENADRIAYVEDDESILKTL